MVGSWEGTEQYKKIIQVLTLAEISRVRQRKEQRRGQRAVNELK